MPYDLDAPKTLEESGSPPSTRIGDVLMTQSRISRFVKADTNRSKRRALVKGLVDGNPPYKVTALETAGRAYACNVNWRVAESYLGQALGAFYDVFSETPTYATIECDYGSVDEQQNDSRILTEEFHKLLKKDKSWDYNMQISQFEMVLYGCGPLWFNDAYDWRCEAGLNGDLKVPEFAKSNTHNWDEAARLSCYLPHELYERIMNPGAATDMGWNVKAVKDAIIQAHPKSKDSNDYRQWDWHQQRIKNQSFEYSAESSVIECANYFVREFPTTKTGSNGTITHVIVMRNTTESPVQYLFKHERRFDNWDQVVHPMYYANDGGGYHHSVTGMGVKMYSAMEYQNRLLCNLADKTFAPKLLFQPTTANAEQQLNMIQFADFGKVPGGFQLLQTPVGSFIEDGVVFNREISRLVASNLSQYRQELRKEDGNPATATQIVHDAQQQARLGKTQLNRYYEQLDGVYAEMYRRASSPSMNENLPGGREAKEFQKRCKERGVKPEALRRATAKATRVTGQGSEFMRQQNLEFLLGLVSMLPEDGRDNLIMDIVASRAGQPYVQRYYNVQSASNRSDDHKALATLQVAAMKEGIPPVMSGSQNHVIYAQVFLQAAAQAVNSAAQGQSDPREALAFMELAGPAIAQHLEAIKADPSRKQIYDILAAQFKEVGKRADELQKVVQQQMQQAQEQAIAAQRVQAINNGTDPQTAIKAAETGQKIRMQWTKTNESLRQKEEKHRQSLALNDATTANEIRRQQAQDAAKAESETTQ